MAAKKRSIVKKPVNKVGGAGGNGKKKPVEKPKPQKTNVAGAGGNGKQRKKKKNPYV